MNIEEIKAALRHAASGLPNGLIESASPQADSALSVLSDALDGSSSTEVLADLAAASTVHEDLRAAAHHLDRAAAVTAKYSNRI